MPHHGLSWTVPPKLLIVPKPLDPVTLPQGKIPPKQKETGGVCKTVLAVQEV